MISAHGYRMNAYPFEEWYDVREWEDDEFEGRFNYLGGVVARI